MADPTDDPRRLHLSPGSENPWAVEHYGFPAAPEPDNATTPAAAPAHTSYAVSRSPASAKPRSRGRLLLASGVLSIGLIAGVGGFAVAQAADDPGQGQGGAGVRSPVAHAVRDAPQGRR